MMEGSGESSPERSGAPGSRAKFEPGDLIVDRYELLDTLGQGGMGRVFSAFDRKEGRELALKVAFLGGESAARSRFLREGELTAAVQHPNVVRIFDVGMADERHGYLVLERLYGEALSDRMDRALLTLTQAFGYLDALLAALCACHSSGVVHRDVKPANVFLSERPEGEIPTLIDFGLGKPLSDHHGITEQGAIVGTPGYMAPEQVLARAIDARTDLHGFGVIAYELLTGKNPFLVGGTHDTLLSVLSHIPPDPSTLRSELTPEIDAVLRRALAKEPSDRFADAQTLRREWDAAISGVR